MDTHAELIEDLATLAAYRFLRRPTCRGEYWLRVQLQMAAERLGNIQLAQREEWDDASARADAALRMGLSIRTGWIESGRATI